MGEEWKKEELVGKGRRYGIRGVNPLVGVEKAEVGKVNPDL